jgi:hypothetical protein
MMTDLNGLLSYANGQIYLARPALPAMLTLDPRAVRLDCLGYLMQRIERDGRPVESRVETGSSEAAH